MIILFTALPPPPPQPITLILASATPSTNVARTTTRQGRRDTPIGWRTAGRCMSTARSAEAHLALSAVGDAGDTRRCAAEPAARTLTALGAQMFEAMAVGDCRFESCAARFPRWEISEKLLNLSSRQVGFGSRSVRVSPHTIRSSDACLAPTNAPCAQDAGMRDRCGQEHDAARPVDGQEGRGGREEGEKGSASQGINRSDTQPGHSRHLLPLMRGSSPLQALVAPLPRHSLPPTCLREAYLSRGACHVYRLSFGRRAAPNRALTSRPAAVAGGGAEASPVPVGRDHLPHHVPARLL